jgi:secreted PhoX family phosphatase
LKISRRRFLQTLAVAAASPPALATANSKTAAGFGKLLPDPRQILDLPKGFSYDIVTTHGDEMSDGLLVPGRADGMATFAADDGNIILVCNHENPPQAKQFSAFGTKNERISEFDASRIYDTGKGRTPGLGGTTTIVYDPRERRKLSQHLSLSGTEYNCAGGATPWGSWLSCEEAFRDPGETRSLLVSVSREQKHGYVFEVPSAATSPVDPKPLTQMGRFEHEAAAVNPDTGIVYLSEDRYRSLLYRYLPHVPGDLARGGRLQALALSGKPSSDTRNWATEKSLRPREWHAVEWIDLEDVDSERDDLRFRGYAAGAARFARGEGLCFAEGSVFLTCTVGGPDRMGQVFEYRTSSAEGTAVEQASPGQVRLVAESTRDGILRNADNITMGPWGDLIVCEDTIGHCGLVGITPAGQQYELADNAYQASELAGICFSPDQTLMFVNIQHRGMTLAIRGPWQT